MDMAGKKPNVLIVYADQWRAQATGYAGNRDVHTPNLDAFAATALNCRRAVSGTPVCTPARGSLLTGLYPHRHGLFLNDVPLNPALPSMGKIFAAAGYRTGWVGKWHVDGHGRYSYIPPERRHGFDFWMALECTHAYNRSRYYADNDPTLRWWDGYDAVSQTDALIAWLLRADERPFFGVLSWGPPHNPYETAPAEYRKIYNAADLDVRPNVPAHMRAGAQECLAGYYAHCSVLDDCFGRLIGALEQHQLAHNTLVLFASDHGDMIGSHYLYDKQCPWDESIRVPFLLRYPGRLAPGVSDVLIDSPDILPTLCGLTDVAANAPMQGRNLAAHLLAGTVPPDDCALLAYYANFGNWPLIARRAGTPPIYSAREYRGVRTPRYSYVEDLSGPWLLYDTEVDPYQLTNLVDAPSHAAIRGDLAAQLRRRRKALEDDFRPGAEYVREWGYDVDASGTVAITNWEG